MEKFEALVARRKALGITQRRLAEAMGVHQSQVSHRERGAWVLTAFFACRYADGLKACEENMRTMLDAST